DEHMTFQELIFEHDSFLSENDQYIAQFIFEHPQCYEWTIGEFSKQCLVSKTSIVRFCQKIGLPGFSQLKALLKWEGQSAIKETRLTELVKSNYEKMLHTIMGIDLNHLFEDLCKAERIILYGSGVRQSRVVNEWKRIFLPTGKTMITVNDEELLSAFQSVVNQKDFVVIVSLSGEKEKVIRLAQFLKIMKIPTLSLTRMQQNSLSQLCQYSLYINSIAIPKEYQIDYEIVTPYYMLIEILYILYQRYITSVHNSK
ncbi:MAG: MurR/RpiR family transcriptional regulator, partial [Coprobacillus sp.]